MAGITKIQRHKAAKPQPNGRAYSPPREEGTTLAKEICLDHEPLCLCVSVSLWFLKYLTVFAKNVKVDE